MAMRTRWKFRRLTRVRARLAGAERGQHDPGTGDLSLRILRIAARDGGGRAREKRQGGSECGDLPRH